MQKAVIGKRAWWEYSTLAKQNYIFEAPPIKH